MTGQLGSEGTGFQFDLFGRNQALENTGLKSPDCHKTGTTLAAAVFKDGVVLGADTRTTMNELISSRVSRKIKYLAPNIYVCGAGVAADTYHVSGMVSSALNLHRYDTGRETRVVTAMTIIKSHLRRYQGHVQAALIVGGADLHGPHLFTIYPHGSVDSSPYSTMGSGCVCAMSILEAGYKDDMTKEEAMSLVARAIKAGILHDGASGSNVDLVVITKGNVEELRAYEDLNARSYTRVKPIHLAKGTAPVVKEKIISLKDVATQDGDAMDLS